MSKISKIAVPGVAEPYDIGTLSIPFGQVDSTSTDTAYTAQIEGITSLYDGVCVYLKNGVITSNKNGFTLNINSLGAKPVYDTLAAATRSGTVFNVDYTMLFIYNSSRVSGGCWDIFYGYNSDTTDLEEALTPLVGTTQTVTPSQVLAAIKAGRDIALQYTDSNFVFSAFNANENLGMVVSNSFLPFLDGATVTLRGTVDNESWLFDLTDTATKDDVGTAVNEALAQAKASGEFDGAAGKSAYSYAQDGGYTGTEAEFAEKLAQEQLAGTTDELTPTQVYNAVSAGIPVKVQYTDSTYGLISFTAFTVSESLNVIASSMIAYYNGVYILCELVGYKSDNRWGFNDAMLAQKVDIPEALPNPNALTFTGAVEGSYDGSEPLIVEIPSGGGSGFDKWECINTFTIPADTAEDVTSITFSEDAEGKPFALKKFYAVFAGIIGPGTYFCIRINNLLWTQQFGTDIISKSNTGARNPLILYFEIAGSGFYHWSCPNVKSFGYRADGDGTPNGGTQSNISQVNKITFLWGTGGAITPGTAVKLWGVRT